MLLLVAAFANRANHFNWKSEQQLPERFIYGSKTGAFKHSQREYESKQMLQHEYQGKQTLEKIR
eukprot:1143859-Pelagomonas_calceolata.AAC.10